MNKAYYECKIGLLQMEYEEDILYSLKLVNLQFGENKRRLFTDGVARQIDEYFQGERKDFDVKYKFFGTEFQKRVWKALEEIPYGETRSYKDIASFIGNPKAVRAVGGACNKNPIWLIVPCHRVIGKNGSLTGYEGGVEMKQALLNLEQNGIIEPFDYTE